MSPVVQAFPSLHDAVLFVCVQPLAGLQASSVQALPSPQSGAGPPTQVPPLHASPAVQAFPSLHVAVLLTCVQPVAGLQESFVHVLPSLQLGGAPPTQAPPLHVSDVVHALPSLQGAALFVWVQPVAGLQPSSVHPLPSSYESLGSAVTTSSPFALQTLCLQSPAAIGLTTKPLRTLPPRIDDRK